MKTLFKSKNDLDPIEKYPLIKSTIKKISQIDDNKVYTLMFADDQVIYWWIWYIEHKI